ncbi:hypothetical protein TH61_00275 [Rufibacter sp. DG15C]|nr:hypothetical protein TH61_00275 [Rufibacter sp. DG15C]
MSDEELDQLFRESAEGYDTPFNPAAWADMDQRLDAQQAGNGRGAWFYPLLGLLLFLCLLSVPTLFNQHPEGPTTIVSATETLKNNQVSHTSSPAKQTTAEKRKTQPIEPLSSKQPTIATAENHSQGMIEPNRFSPDFQKTSQKRLGEKKLIPRLALVPNRNSRTNKTLGTKPVKETKTVAIKALATVNKPEAVFIKEEENAAGGKEEASASVVQEQESLMLKKDSVSVKAPETLLPASDMVQDSLPEKKSLEGKEKHFLKHVQVGIALAPDFTTVKLKGADRISPNAGILVAVPLSKRFSLVTGAVWAKKIYSTAPEYYTAPAGTTFAYKNDIEAVCRVIDIPVNLNYTFWQKGNNSLALQAGLSSYVMLNEKYTYQYTASYGSGNPPKTYTKTWEVDNENRHWFQVQNLSVSYARTFASGLSLGVEPFVKLPLSGIGAGKVNLTSAGVFFSTSYSFHLKP